MLFARFQHQVGEGQTANLYTLAVASNVGFLENGRVQTIPKEALYINRDAMQAAYQRTYIRELEKRLGLQVEEESQSFRVSGVPQQAVERLSQVASVRSSSAIFRLDLREMWNSFGQKTDWTTKQARDLVAYTKSHHEKSAREEKTKRMRHSH